MQEQDLDLDTIVRGGMIVDGTGQRPPYIGDVGILGDRIAVVGDLSGASCTRTIDARGQWVTPGFVDVHVHGELALLGGRDRLAAASQGVTTQLTSADGFGWAPLPADRQQEMNRYTGFLYGDVELGFDGSTVDAYLSTFRGRIPINLAPQVPHCAVRLRAMGWATRPATDGELDAMVDAVREWIDAGAVALCIGLDYQPSAHADTRELVALARTVADHGGLYAAHVRKQALGHEGAWRETLDLAQRAGIPVHISHERVDDATAPLLEDVDRLGIDLTFDSYLYPAGMTHLAILLPLEVQAGSLDDMLHKMHDPKVRERCLPHLRRKLSEVGDPVVGHTQSGRFVGTSLSKAAASTGQTSEAFAYDLIVHEAGAEAFIIPWSGTERAQDQIIRRTATHPRHMIASDGVYDIPHPHPRGYGCFARLLRRFVRELGLLTVEQAVYKMSGFPADRFRLYGRGRVIEGYAADLVVLDPETIADRATWDHPLLPATGVDWVLVNGEPVITEGRPTGKLPGRIVTRSHKYQPQGGSCHTIPSPASP